jgi:hypothetical protein
MGLTAVAGIATGLLGAKRAKKAGEQQAAATAQAGETAAAASEYAADLQYKASQEALNLSRDQYEQNMRLLMPYLSGGAESYGRAQALLFAGPPTVSYNGFASYSPASATSQGPQQIQQAQFRPSAAPEDFATKLKDIESRMTPAELFQAQSQPGPMQKYRVDSDMFGNPLYFDIQTGQQVDVPIVNQQKAPAPQQDGYMDYSAVWPQFVKQTLNQAKGLSPAPQYGQTAQGTPSGALSEYQNLMAQENDRIAREQEAYNQAATVLGAYNRGVGTFEPNKTVEYTKSPGYQFQLDEATKALERSAAARGRLDSGETRKALQSYAQGLAAQDFDKFQQRTTQDYYNYLSALTGSGGQQATGSATALGANAASSAANILGQGAAAQAAGLQQAGQARASGYLGQAQLGAKASNDYYQNLFSGIQTGLGMGKEKGWWS